MSSIQSPRWRRLVSAAAATAVVAASALAAVPAASAAAGATGAVSDSTLSWGLKSSFRSYLVGKVAKGTIEASGNATQRSGNGIFDFGAGTGELKNGMGTIAYSGSLRFVGHKGELDVTFANPSVVVTSPTTGQIYMDAEVPASPTMDTPAFSKRNAHIADLTFSGVNVASGKLEISGAAATLTKEGGQAFASFYDAGAELDPASISGAFTQVSEFKPVTAANVTAASQAEGLSVKVDGSGYKDLPNSSVNMNAGIYAALVERGADATAVDTGTASYVKDAAITDGAFSTTLKAPTAKLTKGKNYDVLTWRAHGNPVGNAIIDRQPLAISAAQSEALFPSPKTTTSHQVKVDAATGLTVTVAGSNYSTTAYPAGVHVAVMDREKAYSADQSTYLGTGSVTSVAADFTGATKAIAANSLDKAKNYDVIVWPRRTNPSESNVAYRAKLEFTDAQRETLFPTVVEPTQRATTATVKSADPTNLVVTVAGTGYTQLPAPTNKPENGSQGVYSAIVDRGLASTEITGENAVGSGFAYKTMIVDGAFSTNVTAPVAKLKKDGRYDIVTWSAHGNVTTETLLERQPLVLTDAQREALFPTVVEPAKASYTATVKSAAKDSGLTATVTGTHFTDPAYAAGAYVSIIKRGTVAADFADRGGYVGFFIAKPDAAGAFTADVTAPAAALEKGAEYSAFVWPAHSLPTDEQLKNAVKLGLTDAQREALFPTVVVPVDPAGAVKDATLNWGVKESFRKYIVGKIAKGKVEASDGAAQAAHHGVFSFTRGTGELKDGKGTLAFKGKLHFTGHGGEMDLSYSNVRVKLTSATEGVLILDAKAPAAPSMSLPAIDAKNVEFAKISFTKDALVFKDGKLSLTDAAVTLTEAGSQAIGGFYAADDVLDKLSINAKVNVTPVDPVDPVDPIDPVKPVKPVKPGKDQGKSKSVDISSATLNWGLKDSFRKYVVGNIAKGQFKGVDGARQAKNNGVFSFTGGTGTVKDGKGTLAFKGSLQVTGHHGELNMVLSKFRVKFTGAGRAQLILDAKADAAPTMDRPAVDAKNVVFAELRYGSKDFVVAGVSMPGASATGAQALSLSNAKATLTKAGATSMGDFYSAGTTLDSLSINGKASATASAVEGTDNDGANNAGSGGANNAGQNASNNAAGNDSGTATGSGASAQQQCRTVSVPGSAGGVSLSWGVKASFVSYVKGGIAKGKISTGGGAAAQGGGFSWGAGSGTLSAAGTGTVSFPGSVQFTGHNGLMNTTLSGLRVQVTGPGTATLIANVKSQDMEGKDLSASNVSFATVKFNGGSANGFSNASVALTGAGAKAFAGFYSAGQAMDSMTLSVGKSSAATSKVVCGNLAKTGADNTTDLVGTAGLLALLGAAAVTFAARRKAYLANR